MATIYLNEVPFILNSYNRNTVFDNDHITSYAYSSIVYDSNTGNLHTVAEDPITSIVIKNSSEEVIYDLADINARITNIDESLNGETMSVNVNINF